MDLKAYLEQLQKKTEDIASRTDKYTTPELDELAMSAATMSGGLGNIAAKAAPGVGKAVGKKLIDFLEPKVNEAGIAEAWVDSAKMPFQGIRKYLQESVGSGAASPKSQALQQKFTDTVGKTENTALRANQAKPKVSDEQIALDRFNMDKLAEKMKLDRLDNELAQARRLQSAEEATLPGIDALKKKK